MIPERTRIAICGKMKKQKITGVMLAKQLGMNRSTLSCLLNGKLYVEKWADKLLQWYREK